MRTFEPELVGHSECRAWSAYYRRDWFGVLRGALGMVRHGFGLDPARTLLGAWFVLRANQAWAPYPDNDPAAARRQMTRFYRLVVAAGRIDVDPPAAAALEVSWWRAHRRSQYEPGFAEDQLVDALVDLYRYVYDAEHESVRTAARLRVKAMGLSDAWVAAGCRLDDPTLAAVRDTLVASYRALPARVVHRSG